jgi:DNA-binding transcriptional MerR regulator
MHNTAQKSPEAFRTISEVADQLDVPQHVLRFWESKFGAVRPLKRGGGRRYYRPDDIDLLRGIRALLYGDGFTIKGVQKVLRRRGTRYVTELGRQSVGNFENLHGQTEPVEHQDAEPQSNIRVFPQTAMTRPAAPEEPQEAGLTGAERGHFANLLDELLELKARLKTARENIVRI